MRTHLAANPAGQAAGIVAAWFGVPLVVLLGAIGGVTGGIAGFLSGSILGDAGMDRMTVFYQWILPLPIDVSDLAPELAWQIGGPIGAIIGAVHGAVTLAWLGGMYPWELLYAGDPMWPIWMVLGQVAAALVVGVVYTGAGMAWEQQRLTRRGARRPSRREAALLEPIIYADAAMMGTPLTRPVILIADDDQAIRPLAGVRHIVIPTGLIRLGEADPDQAHALITHALADWHHGTPITALWNRGVAFPLVIMYDVAARLTARSTDTRVRPLSIVMRVLLWPFAFTVQRLVAPLQGRYWRAMTYQADALTARLGYTTALRQVIEHRDTAGGIAGVTTAWDRAVQAAPPIEHRLERLETPGGDHRLWVDDEPEPEGEEKAGGLTERR